MRRLLYFFVFLLPLCSILAQKSSAELLIDKKLTLENNDHLNDSKRKETLLIQIKNESEKIGYESGVWQCGNRLMALYLEQSRYKDVLSLGKQLIKMAGDRKDVNVYLSETYRRNAVAFSALGLDDASQKNFRESLRCADDVSDSDERQYLLSLCYQNMTLYYTKRQFENPKLRDSIIYYLTKSNDAAKLISDSSTKISSSLKYSHISSNKLRKGIFYLEQAHEKGSLEKAENFLLQAMTIYDKAIYKATPTEKIMILNQMSWLYMEKKEYQKSIDYATKAMSLEKQFKSPVHRAESYEFLTNDYMEMGDKKKSKFFMSQYKRLKDSLGYADKHHTNLILKELAKEADDDHGKNSKKQWIVISLLVLILISLMIVLFNWRKKNKMKVEKYEQMIETFRTETKETNDEIPNIDTSIEDTKTENSTSKKFIASETELKLLKRLENFERQEKYLKKDITISYLSNQWNTNPKYLSEIIKKHKYLNYSNYIHDLRISYIVRKLYEEPKYREYKITYLAEECGYASSQVFVLAFKRINGVTPSFFIEKLKESGV